jgi:hypothetical protein
MCKIPYFLTPNIHIKDRVYLYYLREKFKQVTCFGGRQQGVEVKRHER